MRPDPLPVEPSAPVDATVTLPGSKSITNRALLCAGLASSASVLRDALRADDTIAMIGCLGALGVRVTWSGDDLHVAGARPATSAVRLDAHQSGTTARFLLPVLALGDRPQRLDGDAQLRARPMGPAFDALRALGAEVREEGHEGHLPVVVTGPVRGHTVELSGDVSSQFLSGLLLAGPATADGLRIRLTTPLISRPYVAMTVDVMAAFGGVAAETEAGVWEVEPGGYHGADYVVEPDASAASYAFAAAVVTGGRVTVPGLHRRSLQGDVAFVEVLERMGAEVVWHDDAVTVAAGAELHGVDVDMAHISDTVPTLAVVAALADSPTTIRGVEFIRGKESDRIAGPVTELRRCGVDAEETGDGMVIRPGTDGAALAPATVDSYGDHRMAMAFGLLGLARPGIGVRDPGCVAKTFPGYWEVLDALRAGSGPRARTV